MEWPRAHAKIVDLLHVGDRLLQRVDSAFLIRLVIGAVHTL